jgi:hypothetical protein
VGGSGVASLNASEKHRKTKAAGETWLVRFACKLADAVPRPLGDLARYSRVGAYVVRSAGDLGSAASFGCSVLVQHPRRDNSANLPEQRFEIKRSGQAVVRPELESLLTGRIRWPDAKHNDWNRTELGDRTDVLHELASIYGAEVQVEQDEIRPEGPLSVSAEVPDGLFPAGQNRELAGCVSILQSFAHEALVAGIIVDIDDADTSGHRDHRTRFP